MAWARRVLGQFGSIRICGMTLVFRTVATGLELANLATRRLVGIPGARALRTLSRRGRALAGTCVLDLGTRPFVLVRCMGARNFAEPMHSEAGGAGSPGRMACIFLGETGACGETRMASSWPWRSGRAAKKTAIGSGKLRPMLANNDY